MSRKTALVLTPSDYAAAERNNGFNCLIAVALARQYGGQWSVSAGSAVQSGTRRRMRLGADARRALIRFDTTGTAQARRRPARVTMYDRGKPSRTAAAVKGTAGGGVLLMAASGSLWWVPLLVVAVIAIPVFVTLVMSKVSVPRVVRPAAAARPDGRPRWPHVPGYGTRTGDRL